MTDNEKIVSRAKDNLRKELVRLSEAVEQIDEKWSDLDTYCRICSIQNKIMSLAHDAKLIAEDHNETD